MKKKIIRVIAIILLIGCVFTGTVFADSNGLLDNIFASMKKDVNANTDQKIASEQATIQSSVENALSGVQTYQTNRVNTEVDKYLNDKLSTVATSDSINTASNQISQYATQLISEEEARVDQEIVDMLK